MTEPGAPDIHPLTPDRWPDFATLFGPNGACAGCWCMWWRVPRAEFNRMKGGGARDAMYAAVQAGPPPGVLAYGGGRAIGWCSVAPRTAFPGLSKSKVAAPIDDAPVWAITCFFVAVGRRRRGLTTSLLDAAVDLARTHGAVMVEGYPVDPGPKRLGSGDLWHGHAEVFRRCGFVEVARRAPKRPVMRLALGAGVAAGQPAA